MSESQPCPNVASLPQFLVGRLSDAEADQVGAHVLVCDRCAAALDDLAKQDEIGRVMQSLEPVGLAPEMGQSVHDMLQRLREQYSPAISQPTVVAEGTGPDADTGVDERAEHLVDFLSPATQPGELGRLGQYRVLRLIGEGGMGIVFQAEDTQLDRAVALKVMRPERTRVAEARSRFLREAKSAAAVRHDHVVTIYQVGEDRDVPFLAMELLQGETLESWLAGHSRPEVDEVLRIGIGIAAGLEAAHARGLIHRDIKPANIWLENGESGTARSATSARVKIVDFGLARAVADDASLTESGLIVGTPNYMAPEQAAADRADERSDLFSLGCLLYRMCTGQTPFHGPTPLAVLSSLANTSPTPVREVNARVPRPLADLIHRLLQKDPAQRPVSAAVVRDELQRILGSLPLAGQADPPRRSRTLMLAAGVIGLAVALGGVVIIIQRSDGTKTRLEVPNNSTVAISDDGKQVTVTVAPPLASHARGKPERPSGPPPSPPKQIDPEWLGRVKSLPVEKQVAEVIAELRRRNPEFDGTHTFETSTVWGKSLSFSSLHVSDLSPVAALDWLAVLRCTVQAPKGGQVTTIEPLRRLRLKFLDLKDNDQLHDLSPLADMPLEWLHLYGVPASDLSFLRDKKLTWLNLGLRSDVPDLSVLAGMPLTRLHINSVPLGDLGRLAGLPLEHLECANCEIRDLSPLKGMPLKFLFAQGNLITDLSPLRELPQLSAIFCDVPSAKDVDVLRSLPKLERINDQAAADFLRDAAKNR